MVRTRRGFIRLAASATGASIGLGAYTVFLEPYWLDIVQRNLTIAHLPLALQGKRLVQISDIHICSRISESYLVNSLAMIQRLDPDIVVYTGDFVSLDRETRNMMARVFPKLAKGKLGTAAILGNHDYGRNWGEEEWADLVIDHAQQSGIPVLRNEVLDVAGLQIIGMDDLWADKFDPGLAFGKVDPSRARLVLSHNPDSVDEGNWSGYEGWILAGHTHGGQCKPPFLAPPILPVRNKKYTAGHISLGDGRDIYINRGLGFLKQVRFNVRPEVTVFTLS